MKNTPLRMNRYHVAAFLAFSSFSPHAMAATQLVTDETVKVQKKLTQTHKLKNGIPVIIRSIPNSDILNVHLSFAVGLKDLPAGQKALSNWHWQTMTMAGAGYPKAKVYEQMEKYALDLGCSGGIELSTCALDTLNDHWQHALPLFAALIRSPSFEEEDAKLVKDRLIADYQARPSDPSAYINEIINRVFYPKGHPYRLNHDEALIELKSLKRKDLFSLHKRVVNAGLMRFTVASSLPPKKILKDLNLYFGTLKQAPQVHTKVENPRFQMDAAYEFEDREIPTAYIRAKFVTPSVKDKDAVAIRLMFNIFSEELSEEIRTKRSLSYSVYAYVIQYSMGIGVLSASTSKPKATLEAMNDVMQKIKTKRYSDVELEEYKRVFATTYFLTQETHGSLASAISSSVHYTGSYDDLYEMPRRLANVTSADIQRLAAEILINPRLGVLFARKAFRDQWATNFIKAHIAKK